MAGRVYLVGAGPGDPGLLTVRAHGLLGRCSVVVYDRLVSPAILALVPVGVARIDVGKQPRHHPVPQEEINATLVRLARAGRTVLRLKGGDPFLFGRGGEEALALAAAGVPFEVVPGITAAQGATAALGVPLTHRSVASGVRYLTGHCQADAELDFDWRGLADPDTTLVVYMGLANIEQIARRLIAHGRVPETPVLAVSSATRSDQRHLVSTLERVPAQVRTAGLRPPVLFVIGEVTRIGTCLGSLPDAWPVEPHARAD